MQPVGEEALVDLMSETAGAGGRQLGTPRAAVRLRAGSLSRDLRPRPAPTTAPFFMSDCTLPTRPPKSLHFPGLTSGLSDPLRSPPCPAPPPSLGRKQRRASLPRPHTLCCHRFPYRARPLTAGEHNGEDFKWV